MLVKITAGSILEKHGTLHKHKASTPLLQHPGSGARDSSNVTVIHILAQSNVSLNTRLPWRMRSTLAHLSNICPWSHKLY